MGRKAKTSRKVKTQNIAQTKAIAEELVVKLGKKGIICLFGTLGAGKTTFTKGCGRALGIEERAIKSPSFTYVREHKNNGHKLIHCDFYRLKNKNNYIMQTFQELLQKEGLLVIEWPERMSIKLPSPRIEVIFEILSPEKRALTIREVVQERNPLQ